MKLTVKHWLLLTSMLYIAYAFTMWKWGHQGDMEFWMNWSRAIYTHGFSNIYENGANYLPAYLYFLLFHVKLQGNLTDIQDNLYTIKFFTLIFDIATALIITQFVKDELKKLFFFVLMMCNVAYIYNTVFWGQVDAIYTCFGFAALVLAIEKRIVGSLLCLVLALNFKLQAIVFVPVTGLLLLPQINSRVALRKLFIAVAIAIFLQGLILLPFILAGKLNRVWQVISGSFGHYPYPAVGAFNIWSLLLPGRTITGMYEINDQEIFHLLTYRQTGYVMFFTILLAALYPFVNYLYTHLFKKNALIFPVAKIFLTSALISFSFYFFNTEMHERYAHPVIPLLSAYAVSSGFFVPVILASIAYFLNMERICQYLHLHADTYENAIAFDPKFVAVIYLMLLVTMLYRLYKSERSDQLFTDSSNLIK